LFFSKKLFFVKLPLPLLLRFAQALSILPREKCENGVVTLKPHKMFSVHATPVIVKNAKITDHFGLVFERNSGREIT